VADAWMPSARCIRAETDGGQLGGGAPRVVWLTLGADGRVVSVWSAAQRLNQESRPCHLVWDPLTGDVAQLLPIVRAGCALGTPEDLEYAPDKLPHRQAGVNREGRLCVQIGVLGSAKDPFTSYQMIGLGEILGWLDSWQIPRRWPAGQPAPYRQAARPRSRALWALGGHFGASQVPGWNAVGPGAIDIGLLSAPATAPCVPINGSRSSRPVHAVHVGRPDARAGRSDAHAGRSEALTHTLRMALTDMLGPELDADRAPAPGRLERQRA